MLARGDGRVKYPTDFSVDSWSADCSSWNGMGIGILSSAAASEGWGFCNRGTNVLPPAGPSEGDCFLAYVLGIDTLPRAAASEVTTPGTFAASIDVDTSGISARLIKFRRLHCQPEGIPSFKALCCRQERLAMTTLTYDALLRVQRTVLAHYCGCSGETQRAAGSTLNPTRPDDPPFSWATAVSKQPRSVTGPGLLQPSTDCPFRQK